MLKNSLLMSASSGIMMLLGLLTQHFMAKYLTLHAYGEYQLILSWIGILSFFSLGSFNTVVMKAAAQGYSRFFRKASTFCFLVSLLGSSILLIIGKFFEPKHLSLFLLASAFFPFYSGINLFTSYLTGKQQFTKQVGYGLVLQTIASTSQIGCLFFFRSIENLLFITLFVTSCFNFFSTAWLFRQLSDPVDKQQEKELVRYGVELSFINIIPSIATRVQFIILESFTNPAVLTIYAAAQIFPDKLKELLKGLLVPLAIHLSSIDKHRNIRIIRNGIFLFMVFGAVISLLSALVLPVAIHLVFGERYADSSGYAIGLLSELFFMPLSLQLGNLMVFHGYKAAYSKITTARSVGGILIYFALIPFFGIMGIIFTRIIVSLLSLFIQLVWFYRLYTPKTQTILSLEQTTLPNNSYTLLPITEKLDSINVFKVIEADYMSNSIHYPSWVKWVAFFSFTKKVD